MSFPDDPGEIGDYRVRGTLGAGGQGVVYLAESPTGRPVAVKVLRVADEEAAALLRREAEILPRIATFCTAQVLEVGTADGAPYVVSEYVEGPTLQQAVAARGPLRGRELHRLAVGTITALAAIHRAGVVHRDFKPGNVLLSPEGPRVIDFGIARPAGVADVPGADLMGTPPYMAPEQFRHGVGGPAADLFAWGSTMVFAATGTPPFGTGPLPAIVDRIVNAEPDLGPLDADLRAAVAACLAKDPDARPVARQVLLGLLGRPVEAVADATSAQELTAGAARATTRPGRWHPSTLVPLLRVPGPRRRRLVLLAAALAALIVAGSMALAAFWPGTVTRATSGPLATDTRAVKVPGLDATLHEHPSDPLRVTSFLRGSMELSDGLVFSAGLRAVGGDTFQPVTSRMLPLVSPIGDRTAAVHESPGLAVENAGGVRFTDRDLGGEFWVHVVDPPLALRNVNWSEQGDRLLVTVFDTAAEDRTVGFAVVDVAGRTATVTRQGAPESGKANYVWGPEEGTVARAAGADRISVHALDGSVRRTIEQAALADGEVPQFSAGRLAARCPGRSDTACVIDAATGRRLATVPLPAGGKIWFWYGTDHLAVYTDKSVPPRTQAIDLTGKPVRVLAEFAGGTSWTVHYSTG